jgi:hypothetical protein
VKSYLPLIDNTFAFDAERIFMEKMRQGCCEAISFVKDFRQLIPLSFLGKSKEEKIRYITDNTFRITVTSFVDAYNFDLKSMQKECVHVITPNLRKIPFSAYNMLYRK